MSQYLKWYYNRLECHRGAIEMNFKRWQFWKQPEPKVVYVEKSIIPPKLWFIAWAVLGVTIFHVLFVYIAIYANNSLQSQVLPRVFGQLDEIERKLDQLQQK